MSIYDMKPEDLGDAIQCLPFTPSKLDHALASALCTWSHDLYHVFLSDAHPPDIERARERAGLMLKVARALQEITR